MWKLSRLKCGLTVLIACSFTIGSAHADGYTDNVDEQSNQESYDSGEQSHSDGLSIGGSICIGDCPPRGGQFNGFGGDISNGFGNIDGFGAPESPNGRSHEIGGGGGDGFDSWYSGPSTAPGPSDRKARRSTKRNTKNRRNSGSPAEFLNKPVRGTTGEPIRAKVK